MQKKAPQQLDFFCPTIEGKINFFFILIGGGI
jgi:hypothetical protein